MREKAREIKILFEDDEICVIDKSSGVVVDEVQKWFKHEAVERGGLVHRLDKDTSGVMVLAKTQAAYEHLKSQFLNRQVVKKYVALVHGTFKDQSGLISSPIERHPRNHTKFTIGKDLSRTSITEWRVLQQFEKTTLLELSPHTGRTHQLRVHLQFLHHPIVSDPIYGFAKTWKKDLEWCPRLFLHAKYLEIMHPATNQRVNFELELPGELQKVLH